MVSTPGKMPGGTAARSDAWVRADGQLACSHFFANSSGASRQHDGSGQREAERFVV